MLAWMKRTSSLLGRCRHGRPVNWCQCNKSPCQNHSYTTTDPNSASRYEQGSSLPKAYGGFGTTFTAYGFDLSMTFDYQIGGQVYDARYMSLMSNLTGSAGGTALHVDALKAWTPNNTSSDIPRMQYMDQYTAARSNRFMTSASYLNFQSFTVGYTLPKSWLSNLGIENYVFMPVVRTCASGLHVKDLIHVIHSMKTLLSMFTHQYVLLQVESN